MIRDVTDFTNLEDIQQKQNQELNRTNMITTQMNQVFDKQCITVDKLLVDKKGCLQSLLELKSSSQELYLLYYQFRDIMDIRAGCFMAKSNQFNVKATLKGIETQNTYLYKTTNFIVPNNFPSILIGDSYRFAYIVKKLILNGHARSQTYQSAIDVRFRFVNDNDDLWTEKLDSGCESSSDEEDINFRYFQDD